MIKNAIGFVFSLIFSLLLLEIFVNRAGIQTPSTTDFDEVIGRTRKANVEFTMFNEGFSMGQINQYGYLGPDYPPEKKAGIRLALLGDSYVESFQLFRRDQLHTIIEKMLTQSLGMPVEVLNFGRSGFDLADMYAYQQTYVNRFDPDLIVYFLSDADLACTQTDPLVPKVIMTNGNIEITNAMMPVSYRDNFVRTKFFFQESSILQMLNNSRKLIKSGQFLPKMLDKFYFQEVKEISPIKPDINVPEVAKKIAENFSSKVVVCNRGSEQLPKEFIDVLYDNQTPFLDINDTLTAYKNSGGSDPFFWPVTKKRGHWNYQAHQVVGHYLSDHLELIIRKNQEK
ncbi:MAG: hypothetical protein RBR87_15675 [Bacteroidales bacterium]|jgi:hypothetical protein|nr:hypothetical protein [Bacteroidales bacterium]